MSSAALETFLARLYTDPAVLARFDADPEGEALRAGLSAPDARALVDADRVGLRMAADSFGRKRALHLKPLPPLHRRLLWRLLGR
jgi:hypothetical protein